MSTIKTRSRVSTRVHIMIGMLAVLSGLAFFVLTSTENSFMAFAPSSLKMKITPIANVSLNPSSSPTGVSLSLQRPLSEILQTCPTDEDIAQFRRDYNITFDQAVADDPSFWNPACVPGNSARSPIIRLYDTFRVMRQIRFSQPLPILNNRNLYDWLRGSGLELIQVFAPRSSTDYSHGWDHQLSIRADTLMHDIPSSGLSYEQLILGEVALFLHEGFHAQTNIGHTCNVPRFGNDESLEFGGAWAVQFYYYRWLAEQSGAYLDMAQKQWARTRAIENAEIVFCHISPDLQHWIDENR